MERNQEMKLIQNITTDQIPIGGAGQVLGFGPYAVQGDAVNQRLGNRMTVKSLALRFNVKLTAIEALGCSVRFIVAYDRQARGANPNVTNMLSNDDVLSNYQTIGADRGRFQFLADRTINFGIDDTNWSDSYFIKKDFNVIYDGDAGTVADVERGNFILLSLAEGNQAAIDVDFMFNFKLTDD